MGKRFGFLEHHPPPDAKIIRPCLICIVFSRHQSLRVASLLYVRPLKGVRDDFDDPFKFAKVW